MKRRIWIVPIVLALCVLALWPSESTSALQARARTGRIKAVAAIALPSATEPDTHYIPVALVERPPLEPPPIGPVIEPVEPARQRPAMESPNGVDGDRPARPIPGLEITEEEP